MRCDIEMALTITVPNMLYFSKSLQKKHLYAVTDISFYLTLQLPHLSVVLDKLKIYCREYLLL